jgi:hypothetical protein
MELLVGHEFNGILTAQAIVTETVPTTATIYGPCRYVSRNSIHCIQEVVYAVFLYLFVCIVSGAPLERLSHRLTAFVKNDFIVIRDQSQIPSITSRHFSQSDAWDLILWLGPWNAKRNVCLQDWRHCDKQETELKNKRYSVAFNTGHGVDMKWQTGSHLDIPRIWKDSERSQKNLICQTYQPAHNSGKNGRRKKSFLYDHLHILLDKL